MFIYIISIHNIIYSNSNGKINTNNKRILNVNNTSPLAIYGFNNNIITTEEQYLYVRFDGIYKIDGVYLKLSGLIFIII